MVRPSPFCVLDEIDAPLDESNINRFVLERYSSRRASSSSSRTTNAHHRQADILYGVTMEERGNEQTCRDEVDSAQEVATRAATNGSGNGHGEQLASVIWLWPVGKL